MKQISYASYLSMLFAFAITCFLISASPTKGQEDVVWTTPVQLSNPDGIAGVPTVIADSAGNAHFMWAEKSQDEETPGAGDALFYARWDFATKQLSLPNDVISSQEGVQFPSLAFTTDGKLHAIWGSVVGSTLYYAQAPACCAQDARNWSQPIVLAGPVLAQAFIKADRLDQLHLVYASEDTNSVFYLRSNDGGETWTAPQRVGGPSEPSQNAFFPRLSIDDAGTIHVAWSVAPWPGVTVNYTRSHDGGKTWDVPQVIDSNSNQAYVSADYGPIFIDVETRETNEVHLIWDGAPTIERNHIWSSDGGRTWSKPTIVIPELTVNGRQAANDMEFDSLGTMHVVALGRPWHASWKDGRWSKSNPIQPRGERVEHMASSLNLGNQLHVVWMKFRSPTDVSVWYARGLISAERIAPQPLPGNSGTDKETASSQLEEHDVEAQAQFVPTSEVDIVFNSENAPQNSGTDYAIILAAALSFSFLSIMIVIIQRSLRSAR